MILERIYSAAAYSRSVQKRMLEFTEQSLRGPMHKEEFSRTALATATMRAAHRMMDGTLILDDSIAAALLGPHASQQIQENKERYQGPVSTALRAHVVLRSRYTEDRLKIAMARGIQQYIIVGAGLDTFALRQPTWAQNIAIVEVDHPATQTAKRNRIAAAGLALPPNLRFVAVDFEQESLRGALLGNGVDTTQSTFFSWLGVTMYLTEPAIDAALNTMASFPAGSEVVLTFSEPPENKSLLATAANAALSKHVAELGEPFISYFEPAAMQTKLLRSGFSSVEFLSAADAQSRYFQDSTLLPPRRTGIVTAIR
jgi:methyltransferase (TIGR00027 family)